VLTSAVLLAASGVVQSDMCAEGAKAESSCPLRQDEDRGLPGPTSVMVQAHVLESEMRVDEERHEALLAAAPTAQLSKVEATLAPSVALPQQTNPGRSDAGSNSETIDSKDAGSLMESFDRRYMATAAVGSQLLRSLKRRVAAELREFLRCLGVSELVLAVGVSTWTLVFLVPMLIVSLIVLFIGLRAWWKDALASQERRETWDRKTPTARGSFKDATFMPQPPQVSGASQPPSVMGLLATPGKPRDMTPAKTPGMTPQKPATPVIPQSGPAAEGRLVSLESPKQSFEQLVRAAHLCSELVVPDHNECSLLLPEIVEGDDKNGMLSIDDVNGMAVLYAAYSLAPQAPMGRSDFLLGNGKRLILRSALEDIILASCKDAEPETVGGPPGLVIFNKAEEAFGILSANNQGPRSSYTMSLCTGKVLSIRRDIKALSSCVTDNDGWLLACSEEAGERGRTIRISPQVDAGLMTLVMLGIDILDIAMGAGASSDHAFTPGLSRQEQSRTSSFRA